MSPRIVSVPTEQWAGRLASELRSWLRTNHGATICVPTGLTPAPMYAQLPDQCFAHHHVILLDEFGGLDHDDPGRCASMLRRDIFNRTSTTSFVAPDVDTNDHAHATELFATQLSTRALDLAILGIGSNGHIGMNEPGAPVDAIAHLSTLAESTSRGALGYGARRAPTWGITVGIGALLGAEEVWLLATGERKRAIVERSLRRDVCPDVPASLLQQHPNCTIWVDW